MSQKIENQLNLALSITEEERQKSESLDIGYDLEEKEWELIVKYSGTLERVRTRAVYVTELTGGYAIIQIKESQIKELAAFPEVEFIEKPKSLYFQIENGRRVSCIDEVQAAPFFSSIGQEGLEDNQQKKQSFPLLGKEVLIGIVDSGIDYENSDFRNADGTTRILALWDQTLQNGKPPQGYHIGTEFTSEQINEALRMEVREERYRIVPSRDTSGHGTAVAGIAAGNGRGSKNGKYRGAAPEAGLLIVKMGGAGETGFPRTTQLMRGVDYIVRKAEELKKPVAINISFGNTYGSHDGTSLLERYLNTVSERWKSVICVGSGNEGTTAGHAAGEYRKGMMTEVQLAVQQREKSFSLQIWKSYVDEVTITIVDPSGNHSGRLEEKEGTLADALCGADIFIGVSAPNIVTEDMVASMNKDAILFAMANPVPEIMPDLAKKAGAKVVGTGRSDFPNQVNNVVAFPGIFRSALEGRATQITEEMKLAAAHAIAGLVAEEDLSDTNILRDAFDPGDADAVSAAVKALI